MAIAISTDNALAKPSNSVPASASSRHSWFCLLSAAILLLFADGEHTIALAAWLAPALLLRFVRTQPAVRGLATAYGVLVVLRGIAFHRMTPIPGIFYYIFLLISGISALLPYVADRLLAHRLPGVLNSLMFPCLLVATQFVYAHGPVGSWGSVPYTQAGNLPLMQLLSVTGLWGITFLIGWFAAAVNSTWEQAPDTPRRWRPVAFFVSLYLAVILVGGARLVLFPPSAPAVRVASLSPVKNGAPSIDHLLHLMLDGKANASQIEQFRTATRAGSDDLLARSDREATAGAKIVFWSETAAYLLKQDEAELLDRGRALAARHHIYLGMPLGVWSPGDPRPLENKFVLIEPTGQIAWEYLKARPTPGPEAALSVKSDGNLRQLDSPYGRLNAAICYDTDFPNLMAQAGAFNADLVLSPAGDWRAIDPRHTDIASFRAVEQGFNLVRQSNMGLSAAFDYQGRRLASMDEYQTADWTMVAQVPTRGVRTIYARLGNWFAWVCIGGFVVLVVVALRNPSIARR